VDKTTEPCLEAEERVIEGIFKDGIITEGENRIASHVFVEADGTSIA